MDMYIHINEFNINFNINIKEKFLIYFILTRLYFITSIWTLFIVAHGYNLIDIAIFNTIFGLAYIMCELPSGIIADRFGRKLIVICSYLLGIITMSIPLFSTEWLAMIVWNILWAVSLALSADAEEAWLFNELIYDKNNIYTMPTARYQQIYGLLLTTALIVSGIAEVIGGVLANYSLTAPLLLSILFMSLATIWTINIPEHRVKLSRTIHYDHNSTIITINSLMKKSLLLFILIYAIFSAMASSVVLWIQIYLNTKNMEISLVGIIFGIATLFYCIGVMVSAKYINKTGNLSLISILMFIGIGIIFMGISPVSIILVIIFFIQIIRGISAPYFKLKIIEELPSESMTTALSIIGTVSSIIGLAIELASAIYLAHSSFENYFIISGIFILLCIPLAIIWQIFNHDIRKRILQQEIVPHNLKMLNFTNIIEFRQNITGRQNKNANFIVLTLNILKKRLNIAKKRLKRLRLCFGSIQLYQADINAWTRIHREFKILKTL